LNLRGAYNLIRIAEGQEWLTAMRIRFGIFEYTVMPFGLCNAPLTFQNFVNDIFADLVLYAKLSKCEFHNSSLQFLGVIISSDGISMDLAKCQKVLDWPQPLSVKTLQDTPFLFTEQASEEFEAFKKAFTMAPILAHFIFFFEPQTFEVLTDHNALKYFMSSKFLTHRQARWAEFLGCSGCFVTSRLHLSQRGEGLHQ
ncbi:uncharacterized protein VP01_8690g1, partial [Puccinia sorghi]